MQSAATNVDDYIKSLPEDRRDAIKAIRAMIRKNIDNEFEEGMQYGMMAYYVPFSRFPAGYHCDPKQPLPFAGVASQKNHLAIYTALYQNPVLLMWFQKEWAKTGKKLDMGKSCIRFKKLDDIPLDLIGEAFRKMPAKKYIADYEKSLAEMKKPAKAKPATKPVAKKTKSTTKKKK